MKFGEHIHGWTNTEQINEVMVKHGYWFYEYGKCHNLTDGAADLIYIKSGDKYRIQGNYWDYRSFKFPWNQPDKDKPDPFELAKGLLPEMSEIELEEFLNEE